MYCKYINKIYCLFCIYRFYLYICGVTYKIYA
nr:MAG TPA: hypothetical protein [Caudoviricetes sp.]DAS57003.1 MAG TPA: hypothetical protein [Caudoviricetes sp.]